VSYPGKPSCSGMVEPSRGIRSGMDAPTQALNGHWVIRSIAVAAQPAHRTSLLENRTANGEPAAERGRGWQIYG